VSSTYIPVALRALIATQAGNRCGYCLTTEAVVGSPMEIEYIVPKAQGGPTVEANPWPACSACNGFKADRTAGMVPILGEYVTLFNPRRQNWREHFAWTRGADYVVGTTASGRATVATLKLNRPMLVRARRLWVRIGVHPPNDSISESS
jgi:hypothetical protein